MIFKKLLYLFFYNGLLCGLRHEAIAKTTTSVDPDPSSISQQPLRLYDLQKEIQFKTTLRDIVAKNLHIFCPLLPNTKFKTLFVEYVQNLQQSKYNDALEGEIHQCLVQDLPQQPREITSSVLMAVLLKKLGLHKDYDIISFTIGVQTYYKKKGSYYVTKGGNSYPIEKIIFQAKSRDGDNIILGEKFSRSLSAGLFKHSLLLSACCGVPVLAFLGYKSLTRNSLEPDEYNFYERGMINFGNTCFFNSLIQGLACYNMEEMEEAKNRLVLESNTNISDEQKTSCLEKIDLLKLIIKLCNQVRQKNVNQGLILKTLLKLYKYRHKSFEYRQEDAQEFLLPILDLSTRVLPLKVFRNRKNVTFPWSDEHVTTIIKDLSNQSIPSQDHLMLPLNFIDNNDIRLRTLFEQNYALEEDKNKVSVQDHQVPGVYNLKDYLVRKRRAIKDQQEQIRMALKDKDDLKVLNDNLILLELKNLFPCIIKDELPEPYKNYEGKEWIKLTDWEKLRDAVYKHNNKRVTFITDIFSGLQASVKSFQKAKLDENTLNDTTENILHKATQALSSLTGLSTDQTKNMINTGGIKSDFFYNTPNPVISYTYDKTPEQVYTSCNKMIVLLKRFYNQGDKNMRKRSNKIQEVQEIKVCNRTYRLQGGILHTGELSYGHYTAMVKTGPLEWDYCNDRTITSFKYKDEEEEKAKLAPYLNSSYMLFYHIKQ